MEPPGPHRTCFIRGERRLLLTGHSIFDSEAQRGGGATGGVKAKALRPVLSKALPLREAQDRGELSLPSLGSDIKKTINATLN